MRYHKVGGGALSFLRNGIKIQELDFEDKTITEEKS
jgi:hypothetical protein